MNMDLYLNYDESRLLYGLLSQILKQYKEEAHKWEGVASYAVYTILDKHHINEKIRLLEHILDELQFNLDCLEGCGDCSYAEVNHRIIVDLLKPIE